MGPDGTGSTYYSELSNSTTSTPSLSLTNVANNQYFQYKTYFETDNSSYSPELNSVDINYSGGSTGEMTASSCLDLSSDLVDEYLAEIPMDPKDGSAGKTYYAIKQNTSGRINVIACSAELGKDINAKR